MRDNIKIFIFLTHFFLVNVRCQTLNLPPGSHEFFVTEIVRVKRQAGYVYNRPNIQFDLPTQVPTVSTQAPNVDRTQAQHMFYAYPAPVAGGTPTTGFKSAGVPTPTTTSVSGDSGYNYGSNTVVTGGSETIGLGQNQIATTAQSSSGSSGYNYNGQTHIDAGKQSTTLAAGQTATSSTATSSVSSTYRYDVPSSGTPVEDKSESSSSRTSSKQHSNSVLSQSTTGTLSTGYDYNGPAPTVTNTDQSSGTIQTDTSQSSGTTFSGYSNSVSDYSGTNTGNTVSGTGPAQTATSSVNSSYHYDTPVSSNAVPTSTILRSSQPTATNTQGYNYNDPISNTGQVSVDPTQTTANIAHNQGVTYSDTSGYNIKAPSLPVSNVAQISKSSSTPQTSSSSRTATSSVSTSYRYEAPKQTVSNQGASVEVSTNAPKYLPPNIEGSIEVNNRGTSGGVSVSLGSSNGTPSSSYVPSIVSGTSGPAPVFPSKTYIPSPNKPASGTAVSCIESDCTRPLISRPSPLYTTILGSSGPSTTQSSHSSSASSYSSSGGKQSNPSVTEPSNTYIPPNISQPPEFVSAPPSSYVPSTNTGSIQITVTMPGKTYLLPQGSPGPAQPHLSVNQPSQSYITPSNTAVNNQPISLSSSSGSFGPTAAPGPNPNYLPPNSLSSIASNANTAAVAQNNNYLPPKQPSSIQKASLFVPAATYLPPVF